MHFALAWKGLAKNIHPLQPRNGPQRGAALGGLWVPAAVPSGQEEKGSLPAELPVPGGCTEPSLFPTLRPPWPPSFPVVTSEPVHFASRFDTTD